MKCYYHNDNDGKAAAFCVHAWVGIKDCSQPVEFVEMSYGKPFPFADITENEQVWIVDYSIAPEDMDILLDITADVTWIDHHKTAIEKYAEYTREIRGVRDVSEAACTLAWKYIHWYTQRGDGEIRLGDMGDHYPYNSAHNMPIPLAIAAVGIGIHGRSRSERCQNSFMRHLQCTTAHLTPSSGGNAWTANLHRYLHQTQGMPKGK